MKYFVWFDVNHNPIGWLVSDENYRNSSATEVTKEEFISLGGNIYDYVPTKKVPIETKLQVVTDRQDFLEDCIAEMAQIIYS